MEFSIAVIEILFGALLLYGGAESLVKGAVQLALNSGISRLVVGLTIVSLSTSMPEAVASLIAQFKGGRGDIALGNVIGSNIANIGLIAGVAACLRPIPLNKLIQNREIPLMLGVTVLLIVLMSFGSLERWSGFLLLGLLIGYVYLQFRVPDGKELEVTETLDHSLSQTEKRWDFFFIGFGVLLLVLGGYTLVEGAVVVAKTFGISDRIIGITLVALGTSLPELATSVVAILKGETDLSIGNVVGSNVFNILFVTGGVVAIRPINFSAELLHVDAFIMLAFTLALFGLVWRQDILKRWRGAVLLSSYFGYIAYCFLAIPHK